MAEEVAKKRRGRPPKNSGDDVINKYMPSPEEERAALEADLAKQAKEEEANEKREEIRNLLAIEATASILRSDFANNLTAEIIASRIESVATAVSEKLYPPKIELSSVEAEHFDV